MFQYINPTFKICLTFFLLFLESGKLDIDLAELGVEYLLVSRSAKTMSLRNFPLFPVPFPSSNVKFKKKTPYTAANL